MFFASLHATRVVLCVYVCVWSPVGGQTEKTCNVSSIIYSSFNLCWSGRVCDGWIRPASFLTRLVLTLALPPIVWIFLFTIFFFIFFFLFFFVNKNKQKDEPPEITYCVVNQNGMMHLQTLSPAQPMPEESELDAKFTELLVIVFLVIFFIFSRLRNVFGWLFPGMDFIGSSFSSLDDRWFFFFHHHLLAPLLCGYVWLLCIHQCYRVYLYKDDVMMTFAPPSFGVCNVGPSLANFFFFFLVFCCCFESFSSS